MKKKNILLSLFVLTTFLFVVGCSDVHLSGNSANEKEVLINNPKTTDYKGQALVTFSYDDGLRNNYELALPLHEKYGIPATFNIIGKRAVPEGEHENFMTIDMIKDTFDRGIEIASHSYNHTRMTEATEEENQFEMAESKKVLESIVGKGNVQTIAIPNSLYDDSVKKVAQEHYQGMRVWGKQSNLLPDFDAHELYSSIAVTNETSIEDIKEQIDKAVAEGSWTIIMLHGIDDNAEDKYEITPDLLEQSLEYVAGFDQDELLPINTKDAIRLFN